MSSQKRKYCLFVGQTNKSTVTVGQTNKSTITINNQKQYESESLTDCKLFLLFFMSIFMFSLIFFFAGVHEIPKDRELQSFYDKTCTMKNVSNDDPNYDSKLDNVIINGKVCAEKYFPQVYEKKSIKLIITGIMFGLFSISLCIVCCINLYSKRFRNMIIKSS